MTDEMPAVLTLNVGGVLYTTTRATLTKYPDSMLGIMFSELRHLPAASCDQQGNYFIDRDGYMFRHILNFLRTGQLCLPHGFKDFDLLEAEADFYQIDPLIEAVRTLRGGGGAYSPDGSRSGFQRHGHYVEMLDFEETAYFCRFYSDPPRGINTELKNSGMVISGATTALLLLPLPERTLRELKTGDAVYRTINVSSASCPKMAVIHHLQSTGWQLVTTSFSNCTNSEGSYMVHKYMWYLPTVS